jgi:hypothetical protein
MQLELACKQHANEREMKRSDCVLMGAEAAFCLPPSIIFARRKGQSKILADL